MNQILMQDENFIRCSTMIAELLLKYRDIVEQHSGEPEGSPSSLQIKKADETNFFGMIAFHLHGRRKHHKITQNPFRLEPSLRIFPAFFNSLRALSTEA